MTEHYGGKYKGGVVVLKTDYELTPNQLKVVHDLRNAVEYTHLQDFEIFNLYLNMFEQNKDIDALIKSILDEQEIRDLEISDKDKLRKNLYEIFSCETKSAGKKPKYKYNGKLYTVRTGVRGGKYILVKDKKVYVN